MAKFDADTLGELREFREVSIRTEKHPESAVVIWVVVADDEVFVRSVRGSEGRWYRDLATGGPATLQFAGRRLGVQALPASDAHSIARASREYLRKYQPKPLRTVDGSRRGPADHIAAGAALTRVPLPGPPGPRISSGKRMIYRKRPKGMHRERIFAPFAGPRRSSAN